MLESTQALTDNLPLNAPPQDMGDTNRKPLEQPKQRSDSPQKAREGVPYH